MLNNFRYHIISDIKSVVLRSTANSAKSFQYLINFGKLKINPVSFGIKELKYTLSGRTQILATESPLKIDEKCFLFHL